MQDKLSFENALGVKTANAILQHRIIKLQEQLSAASKSKNKCDDLLNASAPFNEEKGKVLRFW